MSPTNASPDLVYCSLDAKLDQVVVFFSLDFYNIPTFPNILPILLPTDSILRGIVTASPPGV